MRLRWPVAVLAIFTAAVLGAHAGGMLRFAFPMLAVFLGLYLEGTSTPRYLVFVMWLWALTPLVRRLADLQGGWQDPSTIILTPYLVTSLCVVQMFLRVVVLRTRSLQVPAGAVVFAAVALGAGIGLPIGLLMFPSAAALEALNWLLPPALAWRIALLTERQLADIEHTLAATFQEIALVVGVYAVYQLVAAPVWDTDWMGNVAMNSIGRPAPFELRVFSTMHSPGVLALFVVVPLTIWLARPRMSGVPAACCATAAMLMSQVRAAWLGFAIAAVLVAAGLPTRLRLRVLMLVPLVALGLLPFTSVPDISDVFSARLATLTEPSNDGSALSRLEGHAFALDFVADHPFGGGMGFTDPRLEEFLGMRDSVFVASFVQFGIAGGLTYVVGFCGLFVLMWEYYRRAVTSERLGLACAGLAILSTAALGTVTAGPTGIVVWTIGGLAAANRAHVLAWRVPRRVRDAGIATSAPGITSDTARAWS